MGGGGRDGNDERKLLRRNESIICTLHTTFQGRLGLCINAYNPARISTLVTFEKQINLQTLY